MHAVRVVVVDVGSNEPICSPLVAWLKRTWGARRIHSELEKLDIRLGLATVSR